MFVPWNLIEMSFNKKNLNLYRCANDNGATSSASRPSKRARIIGSHGDGLVAALDRAEGLSDGIKKAAKGDKTLPQGLYEIVDNLPCFEHDRKSFYFGYLVNRPHVARAFDSLPYDHKITWISRFVSDNFHV